MKKTSIVIGNIIFWVMLNIAPANAGITVSFAPPPETVSCDPPPTKPIISKEYLDTINNLLNKHIELNQKKIDKTIKIHDSITGNRVKRVLPSGMDYFLEDPESIYPNISQGQLLHTFPAPNAKVRDAPSFYKTYIYDSYSQEGIHLKPIKEMHEEISTRIKYQGAIARAVSLQALQDTEKRFEKISHLLNATGKTQDLKETTKLQAELKYMLTMIQNESIKVRMIGNFFNNENDLIKRQRIRIFLPASTQGRQMPTIKFTP
ncbi:hypothetical protein MNL06_07330 [Bartonella krasnovii]|uniref:type IV secretion system protein n=1 Tax=Bartonella krasnovii TaxID=2267275 RepID=UPI001F4D2BB0|nr:type IV secretion system protein [Bartonella krasnovii]UNF45336.1 hypothetical protein MNL06_07330 [Bartonella krasnovii]